MTLSIDLETYSSTGIESGVYKYVEALDFRILLLAYSINNGPVNVVDFTKGEHISIILEKMLFDPQVKKYAWNANFEIACLRKHLVKHIYVEQWYCTQALAAQAGYPLALGNCAKAIGLPEDKQKNTKGRAMIKHFCMPHKGKIAYKIDKYAWKDFIEYCRQDVLVEMEIHKAISWFPIDQRERKIWLIDYEINKRGIAVDMDLVNGAIHIAELDTQRNIDEIIKLTGISNPKSNAQIKKLINDATGEEVTTLNKASIDSVKNLVKDDATLKRVLEIRDSLSKTSIKKYIAIRNAVCKDGRIHGMLKYYGANRTGRWAGQIVQPHNLPRGTISDVSLARYAIQMKDAESILMMYGELASVLSSCIRSAFIPSAGKWLIPSDFSAIEARVIAWYADEDWRLEVFKTHGKIYEASASKMFNIPIEDVTKEIRAKGKVAELALGYQGAAGALERMGGAAMGLSNSDMTSIVQAWRKANKKIVKLWYNVQDAVKQAIETGFSEIKYLKFYTINNNLLIELPSGRKLAYLACSNDVEGRITYRGVNQTTAQWEIQDTYGGKLVENIVQATARDIMCEAIIKLKEQNIPLVLHVHDEIVAEVTTDLSEVITKILSSDVSWAPGLPLKAETFITPYYTK